MNSDDNSGANFVSDVGRKRLKSLVLPERKKRKTLAVEMPKPVDDRKSFECLLCSEVLYEPYPKKIKSLIDKIENNRKQYEKESRERYEREVAELRREGKSLPPFVFVPPGISENDRKFFCRTHRIEFEFKPMMKERQYPKYIDFEAIGDRIGKFEDDLRAIIDRSTSSVYLNNAMKRAKDLGMKANSTNEVMKVFDKFLPGYYGNRGLDYIMDALNNRFLKTEYLSAEKTSPLTPVEFIQQVLVPECGLRLIQQDRDNKISLEEAAKIMKESEEYGSVVYFKPKKARISAREISSQESF